MGAFSYLWEGTIQAVKEVELICWCGEPFTFYRPKGVRGRNPATNPDHPECTKKRQNQNRARSRARARDGEESFRWHIPVPTEAKDLTVEELAERADSLKRPWWLTGVQDLPAGGWGFDQSRPEPLSAEIQYLTPEEEREARRWLSEHRAGVLSGCDVGRTSERVLDVIGGVEPWNTVRTHRDVPTCYRNELAPMEPFVMDL